MIGKWIHCTLLYGDKMKINDFTYAIDGMNGLLEMLSYHIDISSPRTNYKFYNCYCVLPREDGGHHPHDCDKHLRGSLLDSPLQLCYRKCL